MIEDAILLVDSDDLSSQGSHLAKLLDFFGVSWRRSTVSALLTDQNINGSRLRVLCSSDQFAALSADLRRNSDKTGRWKERVHSAFVYAGDDIAALDKLAKTHRGPYHGGFVIPDKLPEFCGIMAGIRIMANDSQVDLVFASQEQNVEIISSDRGPVFIEREYEGVPVFVSSGSRIINIEDELPEGIFDVRHHVLEAVPPVLYLKWAFADTSWKAPERSACLVIDDPLLRPTYGFVDYRELLSLMQRCKFSTNIAFIPWNWRRSDAGVIRLFRENPEYYSISVHGCAHTQAEFGSDDVEHLYAKTRQAIERMRRHEAATGLAHERVMVFPQGVFSEAAMRILKRTDLIAAVNNDTKSADRNPRPITVADVWDTAIMAYDTFALFTRRYPWSGVENFAFDSLLGKPVIVVIHHGFCRDHCIRLVDFMQRLNAMARPLVWRSLGELVKRSCRQRMLSSDVTQVEMYGKELRLENPSGQTKQFLIRRRESDPSLIKEISASGRQIAWEAFDDRIQFELELKSGEEMTIRVQLHELGEVKERAEKLNDRARTTLRRYLCELRDNYVHKLTSLASNGHS